jgi:hypothetical protein
MIVGVEELIAQASHVVTLYPGDIYATGTPADVGPIVAGDTIRATVCPLPPGWRESMALFSHGAPPVLLALRPEPRTDGAPRGRRAGRAR